MNNEILKVIADNSTLFDAVKSALLEEFEKTTSGVPVTTEDAVLGQILRAKMTGIAVVEKTFREIERYKSFSEKPKLTVNPAR